MNAKSRDIAGVRQVWQVQDYTLFHGLAINKHVFAQKILLVLPCKTEWSRGCDLMIKRTRGPSRIAKEDWKEVTRKRTAREELWRFGLLTREISSRDCIKFSTCPFGCAGIKVA